MPLTSAQAKQLQRVQAIAGFEMALALERWRRLESYDGDARCGSTGDLGPMATMSTEDPSAYGQRLALGVLKLLGEI